jgi:hypothetical protein
MRDGGPIANVPPPTAQALVKTLDAGQLTQRAHQLVENALRLSIPQAMDFFSKLVEEWSLICNEDWEEGQHVGFIFHLLAEITER